MDFSTATFSLCFFLTFFESWVIYFHLNFVLKTFRDRNKNSVEILLKLQILPCTSKAYNINCIVETRKYFLKTLYPDGYYVIFWLDITWSPQKIIRAQQFGPPFLCCRFILSMAMYGYFMLTKWNSIQIFLCSIYIYAND